jgi:hypothetical protein
MPFQDVDFGLTLTNFIEKRTYKFVKKLSKNCKKVTKKTF